MAHPDGTKAWRKGWRRRWREGSSFRALSPLARLLVIWVEDNADDDGQVTTTIRHLESVFSCGDHRLSPSRGAIWRALREAKKAEILRTGSGQGSEQEAGKLPTTITRVNFREYQDVPEEKRAEKRAGLEKEAGLSGRGSQIRESKKKGAEAPPREGWQGLIDSLTTEWQGQYLGQQLVWAPRDFKSLKALRAAIADGEIVRRFKNYLGNPDPFYVGHPVATFVSQVNKFVAAPVRAAGFVTAESHESFAARGGGTQKWQ